MSDDVAPTKPPMIEVVMESARHGNAQVAAVVKPPPIEVVMESARQGNAPATATTSTKPPMIEVVMESARQGQGNGPVAVVSVRPPMVKGNNSGSVQSVVFPPKVTSTSKPKVQAAVEPATSMVFTSEQLLLFRHLVAAYAAEHGETPNGRLALETIVTIDAALATIPAAPPPTVAMSRGAASKGAVSAMAPRRMDVTPQTDRHTNG